MTLPPDTVVKLQIRSAPADETLRSLAASEVGCPDGLSLSDSDVTDAGLAHLKGLAGLRSLSLDFTRVSDAGLAHLKGLAGLQSLHLWWAQVTEGGVTELEKALPNCQIDGP